MSFQAKNIYCPECDEDYAIAWSEEKDGMFVICDCGEAEPVEDFVDRFREEYTEGYSDKMYQ